MDATYVSVNSFTVAGDRTSEFVADRRVKLDCGTDGIKYAVVVSSSYSSPNTTVTIDENTLTNKLVTVLYGIIQSGEYGSLPDHAHDGSEGSGGTITTSGSGASTLLELTDTPSAYSDGLYLKSTVVGTEWATVSGGGGTSDHSALNELDYASAGHTGFSSSADLSTTSGTLQSQLDGKSDIGHTHDERYHRINFETFTLDAGDISNKYIDLTIAPKSTDSLSLFVYGGTKGLLDSDYTVSGTNVNWNGFEWDGVLETDDLIEVICYY